LATIHISRRAALDLDEIDQYSLIKWGQQVAHEYMESIDLALQTLAENPRLLRNKTDISQAFYLYRVREHYLVCSFKNNNIIILTIKSGSLDLVNRLAKLEPTLNKEASFLHKKLSK